MTLPNVPEDVNMTPEVRRYLSAVVREIQATADSIGDIEMPTKASSAEAIAGTDDEKFLTPLVGIQTVKTFSPFLQFAYFEDQKSAGTAGGARTGGSYADRTLNTTVYNSITGASLSTSQVSLPAGTYLIEGSCPGHRVNRHKCRIYNITTSAAIAYGTSEFMAVGSGAIGVTRTSVLAKVTFGSTTVISLQHQVEDGTNSNDYGVASSMTGVEVYSFLKIWRLD